MKLLLLIYLLTGVFNFTLGIIVWLKNPHNRIHQSFVGFILGVVAWIISLYFLYSIKQESILLQNIGRFNYVAAVFLVYFLFMLTYYFPRIVFQFKSLHLKILLFETIILALSTQFTPFIDEQELIQDGSLVTHYGPLFFWFVLHFSLLLLASLTFLFVKYRHLKGTAKNQLILLLIGVFISMVFSIITNLFLPLIFGYYDLQAIAPVSTVFLVGTIAYAIVRHQFLDITPLIARAVSYFLLLSVFIATFVFFLFASTRLIPSLQVTELQIIVFSLITFVVMVIVNPFRRVFEHATEKIFYKSYYDAEQLIQNLTQIMASTIQIDTLATQILDSLCDHINITKGSLSILDKKGNLDAVYKSRLGNYSFPSTGDLSLLAKGRKHLVFDELESEQEKNIMRKTQISIFIPLQTTKQTIGYLVLGEKASGDIYHAKDLLILKILGPELAVALQNAQSYQEIQEFSRTLERKVEERTHELRETQKRELAKANEVIKLKDEFVFIATHDLRTPVTAFNGYIDLINHSKDRLSADTRENLAAIAEAGDRLNQLVDDLLEVARSESGTLEAKVRPIDINRIIEETLRQVKIPADQKKVSLIIRLDPNHNLVLADEEKLSEVFENLLSNAVKFSRDGGKIEVSTIKTSNNLEIKVSDTGYGIPRDQQAKVFQKFFKYRGDDTMDVPGTGLGLFVVRILVEKMKGTITFTSEEGKCTIFIVSLPLAINPSRATIKHE